VKQTHVSNYSGKNGSKVRDVFEMPARFKRMGLSSRVATTRRRIAMGQVGR